MDFKKIDGIGKVEKTEKPTYRQERPENQSFQKSFKKALNQYEKENDDKENPDRESQKNVDIHQIQEEMASKSQLYRIVQLMKEDKPEEVLQYLKHLEDLKKKRKSKNQENRDRENTEDSKNNER